MNRLSELKYQKAELEKKIKDYQIKLIIVNRSPEQTTVQYQLDQLGKNLALIQDQIRIESEIIQQELSKEKDISWIPKGFPRPGSFGYQPYLSSVFQTRETISPQQENDKEWEEFLEWDKKRKEEKQRTRFLAWKKEKEDTLQKEKKLEEESSSSFKEVNIQGVKTLDDKIADYLENSSLDESVEEEILQHPRIAILDEVEESIKSLDISSDEESIQDDCKMEVEKSAAGPLAVKPTGLRRENNNKKNMEIYFQNLNTNCVYDKYEPRENISQGLSPSGLYLDIDCESGNMDDKISQWIKENTLVALKNSYDVPHTIDFFIITARGIAGNYLNSIGEDNLKYLKSASTIQDAVSRLENLLYWEFLGTKPRQSEEDWIKEAHEEAIKKLNQLEVCSLKHIERYLCAFQKIFYNGEFGSVAQEEYDRYSRFVFHKIQEPFGSLMYKEYYDQNPSQIEDTLGHKIKFIRQWLRDYCTKSFISTKLSNWLGKNKIYCKELNQELKFGCSPRKHIKKKYKAKYKKKYRPYKISKKKKNPKKYWRRQGKSSRKKDPKKCTCYICNKQGHYANECPNKNNPGAKGKVKMLEIADYFGLEPVEISDISEDESLFEIKSNNSDRESYDE